MSQLEFKGTDGNWLIDKEYNGCIHVEDEQGFTVAVCEGNNISNAKLIAASPELLKASIKMSKAISSGDNLLLSEANLEIKIAIKKALK